MLRPRSGNVAQIPKESIEQVLSATDIVDLINSYVPLKRAGAQFRANCPFHNEKTPSFYVNPARQSFHCFGCGKGGDAITFVRDYENLPFTEAVRKLAGRAGIQIREEEADPEADKKRKSKGRIAGSPPRGGGVFPPSPAQGSRGGACARLPEIARFRPGNGGQLDGRLDAGKARRFSSIGRVRGNSPAASWWTPAFATCGTRTIRHRHPFVRFRDRLMFPVRNEIGDVIAFSGRQLRENKNSGKYVNSPETFVFRKSKDTLRPGPREKTDPQGEGGAALRRPARCDLVPRTGRRARARASGNGIHPRARETSETLHQPRAGLLRCGRGGRRRPERVFRELAPEGLSMRVVCMPAGDDPDTFLKSHGVEAFRELLANAKEFFDFKLEHARAQGNLDNAAGRTAALTECAEILALMGDFASRENQLNSVVAHLQTSSTALRQEIARIKSKPQRASRDRDEPDAGEAPPALPTPLHRIVAFMCHLALSSAGAQHLLGEQFESLHEAARWLEGIPLLERILWPVRTHPPARR
jgi:DNA primase